MHSGLKRLMPFASMYQGGEQADIGGRAAAMGFAVTFGGGADAASDLLVVGGNASAWSTVVAAACEDRACDAVGNAGDDVSGIGGVAAARVAGGGACTGRGTSCKTKTTLAPALARSVATTIVRNTRGAFAGTS